MFHKFLVVFLLAINCYQPTTNFEGIIKYNFVNTTDSLIYYIGKDKIRIHRKGAFIEKYGNYSNEIIDIKNNSSTLYNPEKEEQITVESTESPFPITKQSGALTILNFASDNYVIDYPPIYHHGMTQGEVYITLMQDEIYVAKDLQYRLPKNCKIQNPFIANGTGKIGLKQIRRIESTERNSITAVEAVEIIPMEIPDSLLIP